MQKRSLTIAGHHTSIALEPEFWAGLEAMAAGRGLRLTQLIEEIDRTREGPNLSSALRVAVLRTAQLRSHSDV
jgi:predicted DNA-binding ribbon-helix-helix protein